MSQIPCPRGVEALQRLGPTGDLKLDLRPFYQPGPAPAPALDPIRFRLEKFPLEPRPAEPPPALRSGGEYPPAVYPVGPYIGWDAFDTFWWATMVRAIYSADFEDVRTAMEARSRVGTFGRMPSAPGQLQPAACWGDLEDRFTVIVRGTDQFSQLSRYVLGHAYDGTTVIPHWGPVSSAWVPGATAVADAVRPAWVSQGKPPLLLVGHSYGAPCAAIAYMLLTPPRSEDFDRVVTFGSPLWGTRELAPMWDGLQHVRFFTMDDPVVQIPPPPAVLSLARGPLAVLGPPPTPFIHLTSGLLLPFLGPPLAMQSTDPTTATWVQAMASVIVGQAGFVPHYALTYAENAQRWVRTSPPALQIGWRDFGALYTLNAALAAEGI